MKFSIVIPAYNASETIFKALKSCMDQEDVFPFEVIVVNDNSTDNTVEMVKRFDNITLLNFEENQGPSAARNAGWEQATGDYVLFLDSDDIFHPQKLTILQHYLKQLGNPTLIYHSYSLGSYEPIKSKNFPIIQKPGFVMHLIRNTAQTSCMCVKRDAPYRFQTDMRYCEDYDFLLQVAFKENVYKLPLSLTILNRPQLSSGGLSANLWNMRKGELKAYTRLRYLHGAFIFLVPFLWGFSLCKYGFKLLSLRKR